jgi:hypothetical protein
MDLLRLLELDRSLIAPEARRSLLIAEIVWSGAGCPCDRAGLCAALEETLQRCVREGVWYAPVLLQRKKAIERGTWRPARTASRAAGEAHSPQHAAAAIAPPDSRAPAAGDQAAGGLCARCGGSGILNAPGGLTGALCPCGAYLRRYTGAAQAAAKTGNPAR